MVAAKSSRVNRQYKKKYRIRNWREYERGLRSRGDVTIWLSEDAIAAWVPPKNGLRGGQRRYSNLAVRTALTLRVVFSLPLRQTEGFLDSLLRLMGLNLKAPDHTTLSRRNQIVAVPPLTRSYDGPIDLIVDSTGLKILGCGEWNAHKHKASKKRRDWRKLHIGVDAEGFIVAGEDERGKAHTAFLRHPLPRHKTARLSAPHSDAESSKNCRRCSRKPVLRGCFSGCQEPEKLQRPRCQYVQRRMDNDVAASRAAAFSDSRWLEAKRGRRREKYTL